MNDLSALTELVRKFSEERDWDQFHNPKDLAIGMVTEASELLDIFRFKTPADIEVILQDPNKRIHVGEELADVLYFLLHFSHKYGFDLGTELERKMHKNSLKYPIATSKGSNKKYNES